ncbi:response regulator [Thalassomonas viridans]|uniref:Response regulator n=1 Tax=Thalassomonas viridans TaxID=137584 RepID=A0AAE9Z011_9GAMM|nr:response regulator [Thalassomonas viridans]WDE03549.1 response regulator [Thalassomonas viridans]
MKILIVDDKQNVLSSLTAILENAGHTVVTASNGLDGFEKAQSQQFDLFVIDHLMPVMNGLVLVKNLRQHPEMQDAPILFMSTQGVESLQALPEYPMFTFSIAKPVDEQELFFVINQVSMQNTQSQSL